MTEQVAIKFPGGVVLCENEAAAWELLEKYRILDREPVAVFPTPGVSAINLLAFTSAGNSDMTPDMFVNVLKELGEDATPEEAKAVFNQARRFHEIIRPTRATMNIVALAIILLQEDGGWNEDDVTQQSRIVEALRAERSIGIVMARQVMQDAYDMLRNVQSA